MSPPSFTRSFLRRSFADRGKLRVAMLQAGYCEANFLHRLDEKGRVSTTRKPLPGKSLMIVSDVYRWLLLLSFGAAKRSDINLNTPAFIMAASGSYR